MRWEKLGQIFDPSIHGKVMGGIEFAQSPQVLVLEDRIRVYFSTRIQDAPGMFISRIAFVDFDPTLREIIGHSTENVLEPGALGAFDEHGIFPMNVVARKEAVWAYTCGWTRRVSVPVDTAIGLAISENGGKTFKRQGTGPILAASVNEPFLVGDPFVQWARGRWMMTYIFGQRWISGPHGDPERVYKVGIAWSDDGREWIRHSGHTPIPDHLGEDECQALPTFWVDSGGGHMIFCYRHATGFRTDPSRGYRLGYAWSSDLQHWQRRDSDLGLELGQQGEWDSLMQCYPHVVRIGDVPHLFYNGNAFGKHGFGAARLVS